MIMGVVEICEKLRSDGFDCLSSLTGTDRGENFEIVYHLFSYSKKESAVHRETVSKESPSVPSVSKIWPSADWMEREVFDLLGVSFEGHPNLKRIMLPDDWPGHPLRKDYREEAEYQGMTTTRS